MPSAEELAKSLAARFFINGNYEAFGTLGHSIIAEYTQAAATPELEEYFGGAEEGFSGLAVHSVGCTVGLEEDTVIIYAIRGSRRALASLPEAIDEVTVEARVLGKLKAGAPIGGGLSNFYERKGRVACGSSCAPSAENFSGTFGCLLRRKTKLLALSNNHVFGACNHTPVGMPILSPSTMDVDRADARRQRFAAIRK